jgi:hypothetical protein
LSKIIVKMKVFVKGMDYDRTTCDIRLEFRTTQ